MRQFIAGMLVLAAVAAGCALPVNTEEATKTVLAEDPAFQEILSKKTYLDAHIRTLRQQLIEQQRDVETRIKALGGAYRRAKQDTDARIQALQAQLEPQRSQLQLDLQLAENRLKAERAEVSSLRRSIAQLDASLKSLPHEAPDAKARRERLAGLTAAISEHASQVNALQDRVRLLHLKLQLLHQ